MTAKYTCAQSVCRSHARCDFAGETWTITRRRGLIQSVGVRLIRLGEISIRQFHFRPPAGIISVCKQLLRSVGNLA